METTIAAAFDQLHDPRFGIIAAVAELRRPPEAPAYVHARAETCGTVPLGGTGGPFRSVAAATTRSSALAGAVAHALARYAAALYNRAGLPLSTFGDADFPCIEPRSFALFSSGQYLRPGFPYVPFAADTPVRWASMIDMANGAVVHVPASLVWHPFAFFRSAGDLPVAPPGTAGLATGGGVAAASLVGLYDVVARDAAALFWQSMTPPPCIRNDTLPVALRPLVARFQQHGDRLVLLNTTTNNRIPCVVAAIEASRPEAPAFVFAAAANLDPAAAVAQALAELAESRRLAREAQRLRPPPSPSGEWEDVIEAEDHLGFAADRENAGQVAFMLASDDHRHFADIENASTGSAAGDLDNAIGRIALTGSRVLSANLTSPDLAGLGLAVCRVVVPGYQPLHPGHALRALGGDRLFEVPQKLGYRGIPRGSAANPLPHPFR